MKKRIIRFSVSGPDGSGKSTLCKDLNSSFNSSEVIHAVKDRNLRLMSTKLGVQLLRFAQSKNYFFYTTVLYFIFYPLEFLENLVRFSLKDKDFYIYDRHPIDRMALRYELLVRYRSGKVNTFRFIYEYPLRVFWSELYMILFIRIDRIYVLLPAPALSFERAAGQYKKIEDAGYKLESYKLSSNRYKKHHSIVEIYIEAKHTISMIVDHILCDVHKLKK